MQLENFLTHSSICAFYVFMSNTNLASQLGLFHTGENTKHIK